MLKTFFRKKLQEFRANGGPWVLMLFLVASWVPVVCGWFVAGEMELATLPVLLLIAWATIWGCAVWSFGGDYANQVSCFLEYLPLRRSRLWWANYASGLLVLVLYVTALLWLELIRFPLEQEMADRDRFGGALLQYFVPGRGGALVAGASLLFWGYSAATFWAAFWKGTEAVPVNPLGMLLPMSMMVALPFGMLSVLKELAVLPSALSLVPIWLTSGLLFTAAGWALFVGLPRHAGPIRRALAGIGMFAACLAALLGHLGWNYLSWRTLDPTLPLALGRWQLVPGKEKSELVASVVSFRSLAHQVTIQLDEGTFCDLGRGREYLSRLCDPQGLLFFFSETRSDRTLTQRIVGFRSDGTIALDFTVPCGRIDSNGSGLHWWPDRRQFVFSAYCTEDKRNYLCVADADGRLRQRILMGATDYWMNDRGKALAIAPSERGAEEAYLYIDLESGAVQRLALEGKILFLAKDLRRVLVSRERIHEGRVNTQYVLVELPGREERVILSENDIPTGYITSPVDMQIRPSVVIEGNETLPSFQVNEAFDTFLWIKRRIEGDVFRFSIVAIDLSNGERRVSVAESQLPALAAADALHGNAPDIRLGSLSADQRSVIYWIERRVYCCDLTDGQSVLLGDLGAAYAGEEKGVMEKEEDLKPYLEFAPSGRQLLRYTNFWRKSLPGERRRTLQFSALEVFREGRPVRLYTGKTPIRIAQWLDEARIAFSEENRLLVIATAGGPPRQVFPPTPPPGPAGS